MRRIRDDRENETLENARDAFDKYADGKHKRSDVKMFEKDLDANLRLVLDDIINETFMPQATRKRLSSTRRQGYWPRLL